MYVFRSLRVKALVTNLEKQQKKFFFIFTWYMVTFSHKMICIKNVLRVFLPLLTLRTRSSVWDLKNNAGNLVYWFAAQQKLSTCRRQKSSSIYSKFSLEDNELTPRFQNPLEVA